MCFNPLSSYIITVAIPITLAYWPYPCPSHQPPTDPGLPFVRWCSPHSKLWNDCVEPPAVLVLPSQIGCKLSFGQVAQDAKGSSNSIMQRFVTRSKIATGVKRASRIASTPRGGVGCRFSGARALPAGEPEGEPRGLQMSDVRALPDYEVSGSDVLGCPGTCDDSGPCQVTKPRATPHLGRACPSVSRTQGPVSHTCVRTRVGPAGEKTCFTDELPDSF